jgi:hypothetical protein
VLGALLPIIFRLPLFISLLGAGLSIAGCLVEVPGGSTMSDPVITKKELHVRIWVTSHVSKHSDRIVEQVGSREKS